MTTAQVCARQGAATVGACASVPGTGKWQYVAVNYPGPSSGSVGVSVGLSASGTGTYNVDTCYVGPVRNLSQVSQAQDLGSLTFPSNASCVWTITQTTFASDFPAVAACGTPTISSGSSLTSPSKTPQTQLANAQPGSYQVTWTSVVGTGASVGGSCQIIDDLGNVLNQQAFGTLSSATPSYTLTGTWPYSTAGNRTWKVQCASASGLVNIYTNVSTPGTAGFQVKYFPNQSQTAVNANTFGSSNVTVTTGNGYGSTNTGVRRFSTIQRQSGIDITYTDSATLGGSFTINTPGVYSMNLCDFANTSTVEPYISYNASTFTVGLNSPLGGMAEQASSSATNSCIGISYYLNQNDIIRAQEAFGATASNLDSRTSFSITKVMPSQPAPVLVGSVTSQSAGALHIESAAMSAVCSVGACALSSSTPGISSITFSSTGVYNVVFATGAFSAAPTCTCNDTNTTARTCSPQPSSNIAAQLGSMTAASATLANGQLSVICMGPR